MLISCGILFHLFLARFDAKDDLKSGIHGTMVNSYLVYHLVVITLTQILYLYKCAKLETKPFEHACRGSYHYLFGFYGAYPNLNKWS
jgi:hypothetical protein